MKNTILNTAILILISTAFISCEKESLQPEPVITELDLASDKLLGGSDVDNETLRCVYKLVVSIKENNINDTLPNIVDVIDFADTNGSSWEQLNLTRKNQSGLNVTHSGHGNANEFTTSLVDVNYLDIILDEYQGAFNKSMFWIGHYDANQPIDYYKARIEIVTLSEFSSYFNNLDSSIIDEVGDGFMNSYYNGEIEDKTDIIIRIRLYEDLGGTYSEENVAYYFYKREI